MSDSMASMQFSAHRPHKSTSDNESGISEHQTGQAYPKYRGVSDVTPLSSKTLTTADRATAWRLRRGGDEAPQPYSARTSGSLYNFDN